MANELYSASVYNVSQIHEAIKYNLNKIYIPYDLFYTDEADIELIDKIHRETDIKVYVSTPRILRKRDYKYLESFKTFLLKGKVDGVLVKNLEIIAFIEEIKDELDKDYISLHGKKATYTTLFIEGDSCLYNWNKSAVTFNKQYCDKVSAPLELSFYEILALEDNEMLIPVYGKAPLMISANCIKKTSDNCNHKAGFEYSLKDRKNKIEVVFTNCIHCYNEIFNNVATSYHGKIDDFVKKGYSNFIINFVNENPSGVSKILNYYIKDKRKSKFPLDDYTTGHIAKGAL